MHNDTPLIRHLQHADCYPHPVRDLRVIETHISWVLLTGDYAYKIKKPLNLGFLDFSSLAQRQHYCQRELELNRRLAPQVYHEVVAIRGSLTQPHIGGDGPAIEYAVKMRQFDPSQQLDALLASGDLTADHIDQLASTIARFHHQAAVASSDQDYGQAGPVLAAAQQNFDQIHALLPTDSPRSAALGPLADWFEHNQPQLAQLIAQRRQQGHVHNCHGDMHLGNMALIDDEVVIFDCIEFNEHFRWMDTISELAFVTMDLQQRGHVNLAHRLLDRYLSLSGDYDGLRLLRYYQFYYAMVRAKVAAIRSDQSGNAQDWAEHDAYIALAQSFIRPQTPHLFITHGLSGSGKSSISQPLLEAGGLIRLRSDVERKRLYGLATNERSSSAIGRGIYQPEASARTYAHLAACAQMLLTAGYKVIVDATFLAQTERQRFAELARALDCPFTILHFHAPLATLKRWIREREAAGKDASEATVEVLEKQLQSQQLLTADELAYTLSVDAEDLDAAPKLISALSTTLDITS